MVSECLPFKEAAILFSKVAVSFHISSAMYESFSCPIFLLALAIISLSNFSHSSGYDMMYHYIFDL